MSTRLERVLHYMGKSIQNSDGLFMSSGMRNVYEELLQIICIPTVSSGESPERPLLLSIEQACGFNEVQMRRFMFGVTETQFQLMGRLIAESSMPIRYSWTEADLLQELFIATGTAVATLESVTYASFDPFKKNYPKKGVFKGDYLLLRATDTAFFVVSKEKDEERGIDATTYRLSYAYEMNTTLERALTEYQYTINYCNGEGASQDIIYQGQ